MSKKQEAQMIILKDRFLNNMHRHPHCSWSKIENSILSKTTMINSIIQMEQSGGEPDVVVLSNDNGGLSIIDCSAETPKQRVSLCYDNTALSTRKKNKPSGSAMALADKMKVNILTESQYLNLQEIEAFDMKTSSW